MAQTLSEMVIKFKAAKDESFKATTDGVVQDVKKVKDSFKEEITLKYKPSKELDRFGDVIQNIKTYSDRLQKSLADVAGTMSITFTALAIGGSLVVDSWIKAASQMGAYQAKLTTLLHDALLAKQALEESVNFAQKTPFSVEEVVSATTTITQYGQSVAKWLPLIGDLASGMSKNLKDTTLMVSKSLSGSREGLESMRNELGISTARLMEHGAALDKNGNIAFETTQDMARYQKALEMIIRQDFGGSMERQAATFGGAMRNFGDAIDKLKVSLGQELLPVATSTVKTLTGIVEALAKMPAPARTAVAWTVAAGAGFTTLGAGALGLVAILPNLKSGLGLLGNTIKNTAPGMLNLSAATNAVSSGMLINGMRVKQVTPLMKVMGTTVAGTTVGFLGLAAAGGVVAYAIGTLVLRAIEDHNKKMQEMVDQEEKQLQALRTYHHTYAGKSAEDLKALGLSHKDLEANIKQTTAGAKTAFEKGNFSEGKAYIQAIRFYKERSKELETLEKRHLNLSRTIQTIADEYKVLKETGFFRNEADEASYLNAKIQEMSRTLKELGVEKRAGIVLSFDVNQIEVARRQIRDFELAILRLQQKQKNATSRTDKENIDKQISGLRTLTDFLKANVKNREDLQKEELDASERFIQKKKDLNEMSETDEIRSYERILSRLQQNLKDKIITEKQYADESSKYQHKIAMIRKTMEKDSQEKTSNALRDELDAVRDMETGQIKAYDNIIEKANEAAAAHQINANQLRQITKAAEQGKRQQVAKDDKARYDDLADKQKTYLSEIEGNEQVSAKQRLQVYDALIRQWEDRERQKVVTHAQAQDQIVALTKQRADEEKKIVQVNKDAEKEIRDLKKSALDYDLQRLTGQLEQGEDVQGKIRDKIMQRFELENQAIEEQAQEWTKQGYTRENIEKKLSLLKEKAKQDELEALDQILDKNKKLKEEEKSRFSGPMNLQEAMESHNKFFAGGAQPPGTSDVSSIQSLRDRVQVEVSMAQRLREAGGGTPSGIPGMDLMASLMGLTANLPPATVPTMLQPALSGVLPGGGGNTSNVTNTYNVTISGINIPADAAKRIGSEIKGIVNPLGYKRWSETVD